MIWESLTHFRKENIENSEEALKRILSWSDSISKFDYFYEREKKYSFGIGKGVVLYKEQGDRSDAELSILIPSKPVKYDSFDGVPISIFCFLSSTLDKDLHLRYLSRFYRLMNFTTFRENLLSMNSIEEMRKLVKREEEGFEE
jgi:mannitol/fructose-specific phosphotransferase system IIA component (Ntr-type)